MGYSGAGGKLFHETKPEAKNPFKYAHSSVLGALLYVLCLSIKH
jgi:hypothetical protein